MDGNEIFYVCQGFSLSGFFSFSGVAFFPSLSPLKNSFDFVFMPLLLAFTFCLYYYYYYLVFIIAFVFDSFLFFASFFSFLIFLNVVIHKFSTCFCRLTNILLITFFRKTLWKVRFISDWYKIRYIVVVRAYPYYL